MAEIELTAIMPTQVGDRNVINTGVSMLGMGGDDFLCGHCGRLMIHSFAMENIGADMVYQCSGCDGYNVKPKQP